MCSGSSLVIQRNEVHMIFLTITFKNFEQAISKLLCFHLTHPLGFKFSYHHCMAFWFPNNSHLASSVQHPLMRPLMAETVSGQQIKREYGRIWDVIEDAAMFKVLPCCWDYGTELWDYS